MSPHWSTLTTTGTGAVGQSPFGWLLAGISGGQRCTPRARVRRRDRTRGRSGAASSDHSLRLHGPRIVIILNIVQQAVQRATSPTASGRRHRFRETAFHGGRRTAGRRSGLCGWDRQLARRVDEVLGLGRQEPAGELRSERRPLEGAHVLVVGRVQAARASPHRAASSCRTASRTIRPRCGARSGSRPVRPPAECALRLRRSRRRRARGCRGGRDRGAAPAAAGVRSAPSGSDWPSPRSAPRRRDRS